MWGMFSQDIIAWLNITSGGYVLATHSEREHTVYSVFSIAVNHTDYGYG